MISQITKCNWFWYASGGMNYCGDYAFHAITNGEKIYPVCRKHLNQIKDEYPDWHVMLRLSEDEFNRLYGIFRH